MTFKSNWEKTDKIVHLPPELLTKMIHATFGDEKLIDQKVISGGCANLNVKFRLENHPPQLLRIYLRDREACFRESKLAVMLKNTVPVPETYDIGEIDEYHFAITEFIPGITLRELLLSNIAYPLEALMQSAGEMLYRIHNHSFSQAGFFDKNLQIKPHQENLIDFAFNALAHPIVIDQLQGNVCNKLKDLFQQQGHLLPDEKDKNLVHADFDPANILVDNTDGEWKITGILDWEFAFSGSTLCDIANMLRYSHEMPSLFETAFLQGLTGSGFVLPHDWRTSIDLLNLLSLLDCLARANPMLQPNQCHDICKLVTLIIKRLESIN